MSEYKPRSNAYNILFLVANGLAANVDVNERVCTHRDPPDVPRKPDNRSQI